MHEGRFSYFAASHRAQYEYPILLLNSYFDLKNLGGGG